MGVFGSSKQPAEERIENVESNGSHEKAPRKRGCVGFMKKWWWAILIVALLIIFVVLMIIFFVAIPKMIQHKVNDSVLNVDAIRVTNPKPDSVTISIDSWVEASDSIHATIDAFEADMYLEDKLPHTPFAKLQMPETKTGLSIVNITQDINIGDEKFRQAFIDYNIALLTSETVKMTVEGRTHVRVKGLRAEEVSFKKTIELKGLNGFKGLTVSNGNASSAQQPATNFRADANIPNPSILTLDIGNATFANFYKGEDIGELHIDNMNLVPGDNKVSVYASINNFKVLPDLGQKPACEPGSKNGFLPFELSGKKVVNLQNETLPYYEAALAAAKQATEINVGEAAMNGLGFNPASKCSAGAKAKKN